MITEGPSQNHSSKRSNTFNMLYVPYIVSIMPAVEGVRASAGMVLIKIGSIVYNIIPHGTFI